MNKIVFPALLVATIMVAGAFAFMPVEQASTVHTTIGVQNVVSVADQDAAANTVLLATSATIKQGNVCAQFTETAGADDNPILQVSYDAADADVGNVVANLDTPTCEPFAGFGLNIDAAASDATDLLDYVISYREVTP